MNNFCLISSSLGALIVSISSLSADITSIICPNPNQVQVQEGHNSYVWTAPNVSPAGWLGSGGSKVGNWENVTLEYFHDLHNTGVLCHYQSSNGGPSEGSINPMIGGMCFFKNGANPFKSGTAQCTGTSPNDCPLVCIPYSEVPKVSASCAGRSAAHGDHRHPVRPVNSTCFTSFKGEPITSPLKLQVTNFPNCVSRFFMTSSTINITVSDAPVCLKYSTPDQNSSISWDNNPLTNNKLFSPGTYQLTSATSGECPDVSFTFYPPTNGSCAQ